MFYYKHNVQKKGIKARVVQTRSGDAGIFETAYLYVSFNCCEHMSASGGDDRWLCSMCTAVCVQHRVHCTPRSGTTLGSYPGPWDPRTAQGSGGNGNTQREEFSLRNRVQTKVSSALRTLERINACCVSYVYRVLRRYIYLYRSL